MKMESLLESYSTLTRGQELEIQGVAMDMWQAYIVATELRLPRALIIFDRFHVSKHLTEAVDKVRKMNPEGSSRRTIIG